MCIRDRQEGEVIPPYVEIDSELAKTKDELEDKLEMDMEQVREQVKIKSAETGGISSGNAASGGTKGSMTLPTPMRSGKYGD